MLQTATNWQHAQDMNKTLEVDAKAKKAAKASTYKQKKDNSKKMNVKDTYSALCSWGL